MSLHTVEIEKRPVILLDSLEDFPDIFPELCSTIEKRLEGTRTGEEAGQKLAGDALFGIGSHERLNHLAITVGFSVGANPIENDTPFGGIVLRYSPGMEREELGLRYAESLPSFFPWALEYDVAIAFARSRNVPMHGHEHGRNPYTSHSQFGSLYGNTGLSSWSQDWVIFRSTRSRALNNIRGFSPGAHNFRRALGEDILFHPTMDTRFEHLPYDMQLIIGVNWNGHNYHELDNGESSLDAKYFGILLRAADLNWGNGEFVALVRHLGLGRGEQPRYTFERYNPPQR